MEKEIVSIEGIVKEVTPRTSKTGNTFLTITIDDGSGINKKVVCFGELVSFYLETLTAGKKAKFTAEEEISEKWGPSYRIVQPDSEQYFKWKETRKKPIPKSKTLEDFLDNIPANLEQGLVPMFDFKNGNILFWDDKAEDCIIVDYITLFNTNYPKYQRKVDFITDHISPAAVTELFKEKFVPFGTREKFNECIAELMPLAGSVAAEKAVNPLCEFEELINSPESDDEDPGDLF